MKKSKLLILLVAMLCLTVFMVSCDKDDELPPAEETTTATGVEAETPIAHEIRDYFVLDNGVETKNFSKVEQYDGELVDYNDEYNLIAVKTKDLDNFNNVVETVTVYDVLTGEKLFEHKVENLFGTEEQEKTNLDVDISYPIIRVSEQSYGEDGAETYRISYYFAKKDSKVIHTTTDKTFERKNFQNGLVAFTMGDKVVWTDRNMEVVRTVEAIAANGYQLDPENFNAEFQGYIYTWNNEDFQVFNKSGICSAQYKIKHEGFLNIHVLNNGTVLIQDVEYVDGTETYDFKYYGNFCKLVSYLLNPVDGTLITVELDFWVESLQTRYEEKYGKAQNVGYGEFPFRLAINRENQAYIYKLANGSFARDEQYVVLNNELKIEYTVKNDTESINFRGGYVLNDNMYVAYVEEMGFVNTYIFDLDGKIVSAFGENYDDMFVTDKYIINDNGIYDHKMNLVYDFTAEDCEYALKFVATDIDEIYLTKMNYVTGGKEIYRFDDATQKPVLMADGLDKLLEGELGGVYAELDVWEKNNDVPGSRVSYKCTFKNMEGTALLVSYGPRPVTQGDYDTVIVTAAFEGEPVVYVLQ